eukprot:Blabericola_migrator_1__9191@NODE_491_length_8068_cov_85_994751_g83_i1_p1_GENE_NODE_491_length_8068_cov_85_994751_g83_i1NODE_491_length_8068_cov_85_994751_g83_i1_p1_ORF_typecomplete_len945_score192_82Clusterin/PF01093_17/0_28Clusterin/PF01093_17/4_3e02COG7/PF10191_9/0_2CinA_KH/PF18146_1/0_2_NODE_491_length_8068_cov_85_994751_g83_i16863520
MEPPPPNTFDTVTWLNSVLNDDLKGQALQAKVKEAIDLVESELLIEESRCQSSILALNEELKTCCMSGVLDLLGKEASVIESQIETVLQPCQDAQSNPQIAALAQVDGALQSLDKSIKVLENIRDWDSQVRESERSIQFASSIIDDLLSEEQHSDIAFPQYLETLKQLTGAMGGLKAALGAIQSLPGFAYRHNTVNRLIYKITPLLQRSCAFTMLLHLQSMNTSHTAAILETHIELENVLNGRAGVCQLASVALASLLFQVIPALWAASVESEGRATTHESRDMLKIKVIDDLKFSPRVWNFETKIGLDAPSRSYGDLVKQAINDLMPSLDCLGSAVTKCLYSDLGVAEMGPTSDGRIQVVLLDMWRRVAMQAVLQTAFVEASRLSLLELHIEMGPKSLFALRHRLEKLRADMETCLHSPASSVTPMSGSSDLETLLSQCVPRTSQEGCPYLEFNEGVVTANYVCLDSLIITTACSNLRTKILESFDLSRERISQTLTDRSSFNPGLSCVAYVERQLKALVDGVDATQFADEGIVEQSGSLLAVSALVTLSSLYAEVMQKLQHNFFELFRSHVELQRSKTSLQPHQAGSILQSALETLFLVISTKPKYFYPSLHSLCTRLLSSSGPAGETQFHIPLNDMASLIPVGTMPLGAKLETTFDVKEKLKAVMNYKDLHEVVCQLCPDDEELLQQARSLVVSVASQDINADFESYALILDQLQDIRLEVQWGNSLRSLLDKGQPLADALNQVAALPVFNLLTPEASAHVRGFNQRSVNLLGTLFSFPEQSAASLRQRQNWDIENIVLPSILLSCGTSFLAQLSKVQIRSVSVAFRVGVDITHMMADLRNLGSHVLLPEFLNGFQDTAQSAEDIGRMKSDVQEVSRNFISLLKEMEIVLDLIVVGLTPRLPLIAQMLKESFSVFEESDVGIMVPDDVQMKTKWSKHVELA